MRNFFWAILLIVLLTGPAFAGIPVPVSDYNGTRTTNNNSANFGVNATGGYLQVNDGFRISWEISFDGTYWNYSYTLTNDDNSTVHPDVSHWIVEISEEIPYGSIEDYIFNSNAAVATPNGGDFFEKDPIFPNQENAGKNNGNPNLGTDLVGVKFDTPSNAVGGTYTFQSVEPPVWGDFYIK